MALHFCKYLPCNGTGKLPAILWSIVYVQAYLSTYWLHPQAYYYSLTSTQLNDCRSACSLNAWCADSLSVLTDWLSGPSNFLAFHLSCSPSADIRNSPTPTQPPFSKFLLWLTYQGYFQVCTKLIPSKGRVPFPNQCSMLQAVGRQLIKTFMCTNQADKLRHTKRKC